MRPSHRTSRRILLAALFEGGLGITALVSGWLLGVKFWRDVNLEWPAVGWGILLTLPLLAMLALLERLPHKSFVNLRRVADQLVDELFGDARFYDLLLISALAGLGEEMLFRGFLQTALAEWTGLPMFGLLVASLLFGLAHLITRTYAVLATLIGLYLGWAYWYFDNLLAPIVAHGLYDFLALIYLQYRVGKRVDRDL